MRNILAVVSLLVVSLSAQVQAASLEEVAEAQAVVDSYKELRKYCSIARGDERKACFRELNEANDGYQEAKTLLDSKQHKERNVSQLHLVSYVN